MADVNLNVNTTVDQNDGSADNGLSLRDAIIIANRDTANLYTIQLQPGVTYSLTKEGTSEDQALTGDLDIRGNVTLVTNGSPAVINADSLTNRDIVFEVITGAKLDLRNITVVGGFSTRVVNNITGFGGIIVNQSAELNMLNSTITGSINRLGGGLSNLGGLVTINNSMIRDVSLEGFGTTYNANNGTIVINNSTLSGNSITGNGGGIFTDSGSITIANSTITNNTADSDNDGSGNGGGIYRAGGTVTLRNTIVAGNFDSPNNGRTSSIINPDIFGLVTGNNFNLIGDLRGASGTVGTGTDIVNPNPGLVPLANNGGFTQTYALLSTSPALNAGGNSLIPLDTFDLNNNSITSESVPFDQRGNGFPRIVGSRVDIGAFEGVSAGLNTASTTILSTRSGEVGSIDPTTGRFSETASSSLDLTDIAVSPNGQIFAISFSNLYSVNTTTRSLSLIGNLGAGFNFNALGFSPDGILYAISDSALFQINIANAQKTFVSDLGFTSSGDLKFDAATNRFYATGQDFPGSTNFLYSIQLSSNSLPTVTQVGSIGFSNVFGLALEGTNLIGYTRDGAEILINTSTGVGSFRRNISNIIGDLAGADSLNFSTNTAPTITSSKTVSFTENGVGTAYTVIATDAENDSLTYSISGIDAALFNINSNTGVVTFKNPPDFEQLSDTGANAVYDFTVTASDGNLTTNQPIDIFLINANEPPVITSASTASFTENATSAVYTITATDPEGATLTYSISGTDAALFNINSTTGVVTFKSSPDFETPLDVGANNVYNITVATTDRGIALTADELVQKAVAITVNKIDPNLIFTKDSTYEFFAKDVVYKNWEESKILAESEAYIGSEFAQIVGDYKVDKVFNLVDGIGKGLYGLGLVSISGEKAPILALRGTEPTANLFADIFADTNIDGIGFKQFTASKDAVISWLSSISSDKTKNPNSLPTDITGHSLGGALSQLFASEYTKSGKRLGDIITFNSPGISTVRANDFNPENAGRVSFYITSGDFVSLGGEEFISGRFDLLDFSGLNPLNNHLLPVLTSKVNYDQLTTDNKKPANVRTVLDDISTIWLSYDLFTYIDPEFLTIISAATLATKTIPLLKPLQSLPPNLIFRTSVENLRKETTFAQNLGKIVNSISDLTDTNPSFDIELPDLSFKISLLEVTATELAAKYVAEQKILKLQGRVTLPALFKATADFAGDNFIQISDTRIDVKGALSVDNIVLVPEIWELKAAKLSFDTTQNRIAASGSVLIPAGILVEGDIGFVSGKLDSVSLGVDQLNKPIGTTGAFLQKIKGDIKDIATPNQITFGGDVGFTGGPKVDFSVPLIGKFSGTLIDLELNGDINKDRLKGGGTLNIAGGLATGTADGELNWNKKTLDIESDISIFGGLISGKTTLNTNSNFDFVLKGKTTYTIPKIKLDIPTFNVGGVQVESFKPDFSILPEAKLGEANFILDYKKDNDSSKNFVRVSGELNLELPFPVPFLGNRIQSKASIDYFFDGNLKVNIDTPVFKTNSFTLNKEAKYLVINSSWDNPSENVAVRVITPNGTIIEEANFTANNIAIINALTGSTSKSVAILNPSAGVWDLKVVNPDNLGKVNYGAFQDSVAPTIQVTSPATDINTQDVTITYNAFDSDSKAKVSLFYDTDNVGFNGIFIKGDLAENDGTGSYTWNTQGIATGEYNIYAMVMDDNNAPVFGYASGTVKVTEAANLSVSQKINPDPATLESNLTYTIAVTNKAGSSNAKAVILSDTLPTEVTFVSSSVAPSSIIGNLLTFNLGDIPSGETKTIDVVVKTPKTAVTVTNTARITSKTYDSEVNDDTSILATSIQTPANTAPIITSGTTANFAENGTSTAYTILANDLNAGTVLSYSLSGVDVDLFNINSSTGAVTFKNAPDFEKPLDNGANNIYDLSVVVSDGTLIATQALAITVTDVNEPTTFKLSKIADDIFSITNSTGKSKLQVSLTDRSSTFVNEIGVFTVDDAQGNVSGIAPSAEGYIQAAINRSKVIFSAINNNPTGFDPTNLNSLLEFNSSDNLRFYLVRNSSTDTVKSTNSLSDILISSTLNLKVTDLGSDQFSLAWKDNTGASSDFKDLVVKAQSVNDSLPLGTNLQGKLQGEVIDLRAITNQVKADFIVNREAAFNNYIGFYQVADELGGIDTNKDGIVDLLTGQTGYAEAAVRSRVAGIDLTVSNQGTAISSGIFQPGSIFAPFIIVNDRPAALLDSNTANDPAVYFPYLGANSDKSDHIRLLGNNTFGFEDLPSLGDKDFNDMIVKVNLSII